MAGLAYDTLLGTQEGRIRFDTQHFVGFPGGHHRVRGVGRLAKQCDRVVKAAPDRTEPVGEVVRSAQQQEVRAGQGAGNGASLARHQKIGIDDRIHSRQVSKFTCVAAASAIVAAARQGQFLMAYLRGLAREAVSLPARLLFPPVCAGCRRQVSQPGVLCAACWPKLRFLEKPWCPVMGTPFSHDMGEGFLSAEAIANPPPFERARAAVAYSGVARDMVRGLKYNDRTDLAPWMARWMVRAGADLVADADVIVPVPLHWRRFLSRRFNQSAELARAVSELSGVRFEPTTIKRVKKTRQQVGLTSMQREDNVRAAFRVAPDTEIKVRGQRVLVVDDVYTTGATVSAVTKALSKAGATVDVLTFARVLPGDFLPGELDLI